MGFDVTDAPHFFGRERMTTRLLDSVLSAAEAPHHGPLVLLGATGSGKSSLLRAGLAARLGTVAPDWTTAFLTPGPSPTARLRHHLAEVEADGIPGPRLLVVDQLEELFTLCASPTERRRFLDLLAQATACPDTVALVALRADFFPHALRHPLLIRALEEHCTLVGPMTAEEVTEAITEPARTCGGTIGTALLKVLLRDLAPVPRHIVRVPGPDSRPPDLLPLVAHTVREVWRRGGGRPGIADYTAVGGLFGSIERTTEHALAALSPAGCEHARRLMLRLVVPGRAAPDTRRGASLGELRVRARTEVLGADADEVLAGLVGAGLLREHGGTVQIAHEVILTAWPRLRQWLDDERAGRAVHRGLTDSAAVWRAEDESPQLLLRAGRLAATREWAADPAHAEAMTSVERALLDASTRVEAEERSRCRRMVRRWKRLATVFALLFLLMCVAVLLHGGPGRPVLGAIYTSEWSGGSA